jgi:hypothetical protein
VPARGRITLVDVGAIALAIALGVGAWLFNPGQDARGARDLPDDRGLPRRAVIITAAA